MNNWFVTVGVPGGEIAVKAKHLNAAENHIGDYLCTMLCDGNVEIYQAPHIRLAPPDLVNWLDNKKPCPEAVKCPGGWLLSQRVIHYPVQDKTWTELKMATYVPVALSEGITVINDE